MLKKASINFPLRKGKAESIHLNILALASIYHVKAHVKVRNASECLSITQFLD